MRGREQEGQSEGATRRVIEKQRGEKKAKESKESERKKKEVRKQKEGST